MNEFDNKAGDWDLNPVHIERSKAIARQMLLNLSISDSMKAMEFGAGTGLLSYYLKDRFREITLMDNSMEMLKKAEQKFEGDASVRLRTIYLNLESEEYDGDPFDIIFSQMVLHHIKDINALFMKFYKLLNPGGILAIADLYQEDGSFHNGDLNVHRGFDPEKLIANLRMQEFNVTNVLPCFVIRKEISSEEVKEYPVFLLTAEK